MMTNGDLVNEMQRDNAMDMQEDEQPMMPPEQPMMPQEQQMPPEGIMPQ
jgi:hypothetical protein